MGGVFWLVLVLSLNCEQKRAEVHTSRRGGRRAPEHLFGNLFPMSASNGNEGSSRSQGIALTPFQMNLRTTAPEDYPCFGDDGFYRSTAGCRKPCCITAPTPEGEDTPKWSGIMQARMENEEIGRQPDFSEKETFVSPEKTVFVHDVVSGVTPDGAPAYRQTNTRVNMQHPGVPGSSEKNPIHPATPSWQKK